jgi:hypothetical protein
MNREQFENIARTLPVFLIVLGCGGGILIALGNLVRLSDAMAAGGRELASTLIAVLIGVLLGGYFGYLAILRRQMSRNDPPRR